MTATVKSGVSVCNDDGVIFGTLELTQDLDTLRGLAVTCGRAWLVFGDGTNLVVSSFDEDSCIVADEWSGTQELLARVTAETTNDQLSGLVEEAEFGWPTGGVLIMDLKECLEDRRDSLRELEEDA
jgi:hypothetical protein